MRKIYKTRILAIIMAVTLVFSGFGGLIAFGQNDEPTESQLIFDKVKEKVTEPPEESPETTPVAVESRAATMTITTIDQIKDLFPDTNLCQAVFDAVKDGQDNAEGATVIEALANFNGTLNASNKGIEDVIGILEYIRNAEIIDLSKNKIEDWNVLWNANERYYKTDWGQGTTNTTLIIHSNPFRYIPETFGGRINLEQPGTHSSTYPEDTIDQGKTKPIVFMRTAQGQSFAGQLDIGRCEQYDPNDAVDHKSWVPLVAINTVPTAGEIATTIETGLSDVNATHDKLDYRKLDRSGTLMVGIGTDEVLHYETADEYDTITPGKQSFKYYVHPTFQVFDSVSVKGVSTGSVELTKIDADTSVVVPEAIYDLYKDDGSTAPVQSSLKTDGQGKISIPTLDPGSYYFKEVTAPAGYTINAELARFTISGSKAGIRGGTQTAIATLADGTTKTCTAATNERYIAAGPLSLDIELTAADPSAVTSVQVVYSALVDQSGVAKTDVIETYPTLAEAQAAINTAKNENRILGPVSVTETSSATAGHAVEITHGDKSTNATKTLSFKKIWKDTAGWKGKHPDITVRVDQTTFDGTITQNFRVQTFKDTATSYTTEMTYTFVDPVPLTDAAGKPYTYTLREDKARGYKDGVIDDAALTITNAYDVGETVSIKVEKVWDDQNNTAGLRPESITIGLYADGKPLPIKTAVVKSGTAGQWTYEFADLPKYSVDHDVKYAVKERTVPDGYLASEPPASDTVRTFTITNRLNPQRNNIVGISIAKKWNDVGHESSRPQDLVVEIMRNDVRVQKVKLTATQNWSATVANLLKSDLDGNSYVYSVREANVPSGYVFHGLETVMLPDGNAWTFTLTNDKVTPPPPDPGEPNAPETPGGKMPKALDPKPGASPQHATLLPNTGDPLSAMPIAAGCAAMLLLGVAGWAKRRDAADDHRNS